MNKGMTLTWTCSLPELTLSSFFFSSLVSWWFSTCSTVASQYWAGQVLKNLDFGKVGSRLDKPGTSGKRRDRSGWPRCASRTREGPDQLWIQTDSFTNLAATSFGAMLRRRAPQHMSDSQGGWIGHLRRKRGKEGNRQEKGARPLQGVHKEKHGENTEEESVHLCSVSTSVSETRLSVPGLQRTSNHQNGQGHFHKLLDKFCPEKQSFLYGWWMCWHHKPSLASYWCILFLLCD